MNSSLIRGTLVSFLCLSLEAMEPFQQQGYTRTEDALWPTELLTGNPDRISPLPFGRCSPLSELTVASLQTLPSETYPQADPLKIEIEILRNRLTDASLFIQQQQNTILQLYALYTQQAAEQNKNDNNPKKKQKKNHPDLFHHQFSNQNVSSQLYLAAAAIKNSNYAELKILLEQNSACVTAANRLGNTLLHQAVRAGKKEFVSLLLQKGASATKPNRKGETPLSLAQKKDDQALIQLLSGTPHNQTFIPPRNDGWKYTSYP